MSDDKLVRIHFVHFQKVLNRFFKSQARVEIIQIADVLADKRLTTNHQRDRIFKVATQSQDWFVRGKLTDRCWCISARTADHKRLPRADRDHGVIYAAANRSLADQKSVGDSGHLFQSIFIAKSDWFTRPISTS